MLNFTPLPLRSDAVQILFLVKNATVKGCRPVKRLQYDDVCDGQLISDSRMLNIILMFALLGTFDGIIFVP